MINKAKSQDLPLPELLRRTQHFLADCLSHRVANSRAQSGSHLSFVFRHTAGVNRKISFRLHPVLHFYRQYAQFVLNPRQFLSLSTSFNPVILHQSRRLDGEDRKDRSSLMHVKYMLFPLSQWQQVQTTRNQRQPSPLINVFLYPQALPPRNRYLVSPQEPAESFASPPNNIPLLLRRVILEGFIRSPDGLRPLLNRAEGVRYSAQAQQVKLLSMPKNAALALQSEVFQKFIWRELNLRRNSAGVATTKIARQTLLRKTEERHRSVTHISIALKDIAYTIKKLIHGSSNTEEHHHDFSLSYVFTSRQQDFLSVLKSYRQTEEKVWVEQIQRQVHEESKRLEKKFGVQTASPGEMTDQVYNQLTRRLQIEKERLGY